MAYWNHFSTHKYKQILFASIQIGEEFREDFFKGKRRRADIICVKTGELSYIEKRSKKEHKLFFIPENYMVSSAKERIENLK